MEDVKISPETPKPEQEPQPLSKTELSKEVQKLQEKLEAGELIGERSFRYRPY